MSLSRRNGRWILALLACVLVAAPCSAKKKFRPYRVIPSVGVSDDGEGVPVVRVSKEGLNGEIGYTTSVDRRRMMRATLGLDLDPFATPPGAEILFHVFLVEFENTSDRRLLFNPSTARIYTDKNDFEFGLDYTELFSGVGRLYGIDLEQIHQIAYDRPVTLEPGGKARKLLVFHEIPHKWDQFYLLMALESTGQATVDVSVPFQKIYLDE